MNNLRHVGIYVKDLNRMKRFYLNVFHMKKKISCIESGAYIDTILGLHGEKIHICKLEFEHGGMIELLSMEDHCFGEKLPLKTIWDIGQSHIAIGVDNLESLYKELTDMGVEFLSSPMVSDDGYAKVCFCRDPEGNFLELVEVLK